MMEDSIARAMNSKTMKKLLGAPLSVKIALCILATVVAVLVIFAPIVLVVLIVTLIIMHCVFLVISYF